MHPNDFSYGLLTPALGYVMSCLGAFIGLRCTTRARAYAGRARARWLALAAVSIGVTGIWVMHFIAMLGYTIPGETIRYNVPVTVLSMLLAVIVVGSGCSSSASAAMATGPCSSAAVSPGSAWRACTTWAWRRCGCPPR
jgi:NO-binding membrane sensor protein with MHYT domain